MANKMKMTLEQIIRERKSMAHRRNRRGDQDALRGIQSAPLSRTIDARNFITGKAKEKCVIRDARQKLVVSQMKNIKDVRFIINSKKGTLYSDSIATAPSPRNIESTIAKQRTGGADYNKNENFENEVKLVRRSLFDDDRNSCFRRFEGPEEPPTARHSFNPFRQNERNVSPNSSGYMGKRSEALLPDVSMKATTSKGKTSSVFTSREYDEESMDVEVGSSDSPPRSSKYSSQGFRIVVSNLSDSVTAENIRDLFEVAGTLLEYRLVRTGVAEVVFEHLAAAEDAVETYHKRRLDGLAMNCLLVYPRSFDDRPCGSMGPRNHLRREKEKKSSFEIDIDALHTALFHSK